jgi:hypothetical protein
MKLQNKTTIMIASLGWAATTRTEVAAIAKHMQMTTRKKKNTTKKLESWKKNKIVYVCLCEWQDRTPESR